MRDKTDILFYTIFWLTAALIVLGITKTVYLEVWLGNHPCKKAHQALVYHPANVEMIPGRTPIFVPHAAYTKWEDVCDER